MRNRWRLLAFDIAAPLGAIAALLAIGVVLDWPRWWVAVCAVLVLLVVEAMTLNFVLLRRHSVSVGTDDDRPGLRAAVVAVCTVALVAAVVTGYQRWTVPNRTLEHDAQQVVAVATEMAEATASFNPQHPTASAEKAAALMVPERAEALKNDVAKSSADLVERNGTAKAETLSAGVEALGPSAAMVPVVMQVTQTSSGQQPERAVVALRVALTTRDGQWLVADFVPIHQR